MKKRILSMMFALTIVLSLSVLPALAATDIYTVVSGDSLWKISLRYRVGLKDVISSNPQFVNPNLIYPGDKVYIPVPSGGPTGGGTGSAVTNEGVLPFEEQVVNLVNQQRSKNGLAPLKLNAELCKIARIKSQDMHDKGYFSHTSPTYGSPFDMLKRFGISYRSAGENIAKGQTSPQSVVNAWMNSSGHRANILNRGFTQIGVGYVADGNYWTQLFIG